MQTGIRAALSLATKCPPGQYDLFPPPFVPPSWISPLSVCLVVALCSQPADWLSGSCVCVCVCTAHRSERVHERVNRFRSEVAASFFFFWEEVYFLAGKKRHDDDDDDGYKDVKDDDGCPSTSAGSGQWMLILCRAVLWHLCVRAPQDPPIVTNSPFLVPSFLSIFCLLHVLYEFYTRMQQCCTSLLVHQIWLSSSWG